MNDCEVESEKGKMLTVSVDIDRKYPLMRLRWQEAQPAVCESCLRNFG
jgi:hypothetical protein